MIIDQLGYHYIPSDHSPELGYAQFDVRLTGKAGDRLFDASEAVFPVNAGGTLKEQLIHHPWRSQKMQVAIGIFTLHAHDGDVMSGFSFGGELEIDEQAAYTDLRLKSSAPVFNLSSSLHDSPEAPAAILASELSACIARRRAAWRTNDQEFEKRLLALEPFQAFLVSLKTLSDKLETSPHLTETQHYRAVARTVRRAIKILKDAGRWPNYIPSLEEVL